MIRQTLALFFGLLAWPASAQTRPNVPPPPTVTAQPLPPLAAPRGPVSEFTAQPATVSPNNWVPGNLAELRLLDKVTARASGAMMKPGESHEFGSLTIVMRSCLLRPKDQPSDAAAFLDITDRNGGPAFHGWMLASAPALSMLEHPLYDIRVIACQL
jgi:hypothetical protein